MLIRATKLHYYLDMIGNNWQQNAKKMHFVAFCCHNGPWTRFSTRFSSSKLLFFK